jgi:hypothetical protein
VRTPRRRYQSVVELARVLNTSHTALYAYLDEYGMEGYALCPLDERAYERWHRRVYDRWQAGDHEGALRARL